jgi:hypothetical protein
MAIIQKMRFKDDLSHKLKALMQEAKRQASPSIAVGYNANYALYVHESKKMQENREARGEEKRQWKYLEKPSREMQKELGKVVANGVSNGAPLHLALYAAGLLLQRASQKLVPVLTGNLRGTAFTKIEKK